MDRRTFCKSIGGTAVTISIAGCSTEGSAADGDAAAQATETTTGEPTVITPGTAPGFPPFEMKEGGELVGFDVDLLSAVVAEAQGYELGEWQEFDFDSLIPALTSGNIDVVAAAMTITDERDQTIDFTDPYYNADQAVLVREDGDFSPGELGDLSGRMVGAQSGTTGEGIAQENVEARNYSAYDSYVFAVQDLQNGNIDAVVLDVPVARTFADQRPVEVAFVEETGERYGFGVREDDDDLQSALNEGLAAVMESSQYEEIRNEWFGSADGTPTGTETGTSDGTETETQTGS